MPAAYDSYDYTLYWKNRDYEHKSEVLAIRNFLTKIKKIKNILEIGAGFGRLAPSYLFRAKKVFLTEPSARTLKIARQTFKNQKKIKFVHSSIENLPTKIKPGSIDVAVMVRVIHHIPDLNLTFKIVNRILSKNGYFIFEFANKRHFKSVGTQFLKGNFNYYNDINTIDIRSKKSIKKGTLPFLNYHPIKIEETLKANGFEIIEKRSVSNIRSTFLKRIFGTDILVWFESLLQTPLSYLDFGPSIFILAKKIG